MHTNSFLFYFLFLGCIILDLPIYSNEIEKSPKQMENKINDQLSTIKSSIEKLSSDIHSAQKSLIKFSEQDNYYKIRIKNNLTNFLSISSLNAKLNELEIYSSSSNTHIWTDENQQILFEGPLKTGKHSLYVTTSINLNTKDPLSLSSLENHIIVKSFNFDVNPNSGDKTLILELKKSNAKSDKPELFLSELPK